MNDHTNEAAVMATELLGGAPTGPSALREAAQRVVDWYTDNGECDWCAVELCRGVPHDADCLLGALRAALSSGTEDTPHE